MTEKSYGGNSSIPQPKEISNKKTPQSSSINNKKLIKPTNSIKTMNEKDINDIIKAGEISKKTREYITSIVKKDISLFELAEKIEDKIISLGGELAFPVNLGINDIAAHHTPSYNDEEKAFGLLKVDFGVSINGWTADAAISFDLENNIENKNLIIAAEESLNNALKLIQNNLNSSLNDIGNTIYNSAEKYSFQPIINLSGHSIEKFDLHSGITIPNFPNNDLTSLQDGLYAIEPFITKGNGKVYESKPSSIYHLIEKKPIRDPFTRQVLDNIEKEYKTLPFASRWLVKKFGTKALIAISQLEKSSILHNYEELVEVSHKPVSQAEKTILIINNKITIIN